jgi:galactose-1-phosphate uridylyltransferase
VAWTNDDAPTVEFRRELIRTEILDPGHGFERLESTLETRWDPLTGQTSRILPPSALLRRSDFDLAGLAEETRATCPFCSERIEEATPRLVPGVAEDGRIRRGEAILFPNLLPYSKHSSVSVYSARRHFLPLGEISAALVADNLATQVEFARAVIRHDDEATWASVDANHMLPSGSSVFHPHLQGSVNPFPSTAQQLLAAVPSERFGEYVDEERRDGRRYLGRIGRVDWLASFAPVGPAELRGFIFGIASPAEMDGDLIEDLGDGIARALTLYANLGFQSFNLAVYGAPPGLHGYPLNLRLVCRSNLEPLYRSDATWLERLHWEAAVDIAPETFAEQARPYFASIAAS